MNQRTTKPNSIPANVTPAEDFRRLTEAILIRLLAVDFGADQVRVPETHELLGDWWRAVLTLHLSVDENEKAAVLASLHSP